MYSYLFEHFFFYKKEHLFFKMCICPTLLKLVLSPAPSWKKEEGLGDKPGISVT